MQRKKSANLTQAKPPINRRRFLQKILNTPSSKNEVEPTPSPVVANIKEQQIENNLLQPVIKESSSKNEITETQDQRNLQNQIKSKPEKMFAKDKKFLWNIKLGNLSRAQMWQQRGARIDIPDKYGETALFYAISANYFSAVKYLLENGAKVNIKDNSGYTLLGKAVRFSCLEIVELLLKYGENPNVYTERFIDETPLQYCVKYRDSAYFLKLLLRYGADYKVQDDQENTLLHLTLSDLYIDKIEEIKLYKGSIRYVHRPKFMDDEQKITEIVECLLHAGSNPNIQNNLGITPLQYAVENCFKQSVILLLRYGAKPRNRYYGCPISIDNYYYHIISDKCELIRKLRQERKNEIISLINLHAKKLLMVSGYEKDVTSLFHKDYFPFDIFKVILQLINL